MNDFFRWTGEPADLSTASTRLRVSGSYSVEGQTFEIPTREDYELALRASGAIRSTDRIVDHPLSLRPRSRTGTRAAATGVCSHPR
jgi:hypothetical protein